MYTGEFFNDFGVASELGNKILPVLNERLKRGEVIHTEHLNEIVAKMLDIYSGIDAIFKHETEIAGVALRVQQHSERNWETFTIRYSRNTGAETEYKKSKNNNQFYPHYTCQVYMGKDNCLIGGGFCLTKDLFDIAASYEPFVTKLPGLTLRLPPVYVNVNASDGNTFVVVPFYKFTHILLF
jgi:hypothetical protein